VNKTEIQCILGKDYLQGINFHLNTWTEIGWVHEFLDFMVWFGDLVVVVLPNSYFEISYVNDKILKFFECGKINLGLGKTASGSHMTPSRDLPLLLAS